MDKKNLPKHLGIIMDGNGRWAKKRGLIRSKGHKKGAENLESLLEYIFKLGIKYVSIYAFSCENFKRDSVEVNYLMDLFVKMFTIKKKLFIKNNIKVLFSGRRDNLRDDVLLALSNLEIETSKLDGGVLNICLNYGGRQEIVDMVKKISTMVVDKIITIDDINEELINRNMYQSLPDVDFVIRTSGEERISNFMLWQSSYAEYYFPLTLFPDFDCKEFDKAIVEYQKRNRRFGGIDEKE